MHRPPPEPYHSITPRIVVEDAAAQIAFLHAVFGAEGEYRAGRPAEIRIGDSLVLVTQAAARDCFPAFLYVYVDDPDDSHRRALSAGAASIEAPFDTPYGDRRAMVRDPFGNVWQLACRMGVLEAWKSIPHWIDDAFAHVDDASLDEPVDQEGLTRREVLHHLAEANVVAAGIVIAALGSPGCTYDWSWMMPFGAWLDRLDYRHKPIEPSRRLIEALNAYLAAQIGPLPDALERAIFLRDSPAAELRRVTVADVLRQEIDHAREHLARLA